MTAPSFFRSDPRRAELAWTDWAAVHAFLLQQRICRAAVNDDAWPYVVAQTFRFTGDAFELHFSRSGKLAGALRADPHVTIEVDEAMALVREPGTDHDSAEYRSVIARCFAEVSEHKLPDAGRPGRRIMTVRARIESLSAKMRVLAPNEKATVTDRFPPL